MACHGGWHASFLGQPQCFIQKGLQYAGQFPEVPQGGTLNKGLRLHAFEAMYWGHEMDIRKEEATYFYRRGSKFMSMDGEVTLA